MQATGVSALDTTIHKTNLWIKEVMEELATNDRHHAYLALRTVLHLLRDRLPQEEAVDLGAQLPMLIRGFYYDEWKPDAVPIKFDREEFIDRLMQQFPAEPDTDGEAVIRAVFSVIEKHVAAGEIEDIKGSLPSAIASFWNNRDRGQ